MKNFTNFARRAGPKASVRAPQGLPEALMDGGLVILVVEVGYRRDVHRGVRVRRRRSGRSTG
ncbi:hypothetical protein ACFWCB_19020, partial [Streptomyces sp. NPDC060048]